MEVSEEIRKSGLTRRFGDPEKFGATRGHLCSPPSANITGQNILIDGGAFSGLL